MRDSQRKPSVTATPPLARRAFLRSAGTVLALPFLESLLPRDVRAAVAAQGLPQRLITFYVPCGINMVDFTPTAAGDNFAITPILQPLAGLQDYVTVATGLTNFAAEISNDGGDHGRGTGTFGSGSSVYNTGNFSGGGITYDQVVANLIGTQTRIPSMQLTAEGGSVGGSCDTNFNCAYQGTISWADSQTPLMPLSRASVVFTQLFGNGTQLSVAQASLRAATRKSILDSVVGRINSLTNRLGTNDQQKLDQYLTSVREVEREVTLPAPAACGTSTQPADASTYSTNVHAMVNLMTLAVQCDATRVISMMIGTSGSYHDCSFLSLNGTPINSAFHTITHLQAFNGDAAQNRAALTVIGAWRVSMIAQFANALANMQEGSGTALDNTIIYMGSEISDGSIHNHNNMPVLLVGKGGGAYAGNRNAVYSNGETLADLYMYMMAQFGASVPTFGTDGKQQLSGLV